VDVDVDHSDEEFEEYEWAGQTRVRASSLVPPASIAGLSKSLLMPSTLVSFDCKIISDILGNLIELMN